MNESTKYPLPIVRLLKYGDASKSSKQWPDYTRLGIGNEHISYLIQMVRDEDLNQSTHDSLDVWAPTHAWRALGQLHAEEAIEPLIGILHWIDDRDDDYVLEELPDVFALIGPAAIEPLADYLADSTHPSFARICASESLYKIGNAHEAYRSKCVSAISEQLQRFQENDSDLNAFLISDLIDLHAVESIDLIKKAFDEDCVDYGVIGDYEEVEIALGLRTHRSRVVLTYENNDDREDLWDYDLYDWNPSSTIPSQSQKIGRNDPCPCGSGKKYKKCCLNKESKIE